MYIWVSKAAAVAEPPEEPVAEPPTSVPVIAPEDPVRILNAILKSPY